MRRLKEPGRGAGAPGLRRRGCVGAVAGLMLAVGPVYAGPPPAGPKVEYAAEFFPGISHDGSVPTPEQTAGFRWGERAGTHAEIERVLRSLAGPVDGKPAPSSARRTRLVEYARTHEGRACYCIVISDEATMSRLDAVQADLKKLADPRLADAATVDGLADALPAVAWLAFSIHGNEMSGSDAGTAVAWHLASATDEGTRQLLKDVIVIIDPMQNPDGRDRCIRQIREVKGATIDVDDQSTVHGQFWPAGRTNHYLFDMNRDWFLLTQPETRGRVAQLNEWHPLLFVDSHEMGALETFLFSPSRNPVNPHLPAKRREWWDRFAVEQAKAFDEHAWRYYTGEWNEEWYPGYSSSFAGYRGAVGILYEQASVDADGIRRPEGSIEPYRLAVHKQITSTMANLRTLAANRQQMNREFVAERRAAMAPEGEWKGRVLAFPPSANRSRQRALVDALRSQGIEVRVVQGPFKGTGEDRLGQDFADREFPSGTLLVEAAQPESHLLRAILEFDTRMTDEFLTDERRELLRFGSSKLYDITGWCLADLFDVDAAWLRSGAPEGAPLWPGPGGTGEARALGVGRPEARTAFIIDGADDNSVAAAAHLMEAGVRVRVADRPLTLDGKDFARGSVVVTRIDNPGLDATDPGSALVAGKPVWTRLASEIDRVASQFGLEAVGIDCGLGVGNEVPDIGGEHFVLLERPRIAIASRDGVSAYDFGSIWFTLDQRLGLRSSQLEAQSLSAADLRRYNVLILPDASGDVVKESAEALKEWVRGGGTLIAVGSSASAVAAPNLGLCGARELSDVISRKDEPTPGEALDAFELQVLREYLGRNEAPDGSDVFRSAYGAAAPVYPWSGTIDGLERPSATELKRRDAWQKIFSPQGVVVAGRTDDKSWLTFGCGDFLPIMFGSDPVFLTQMPAQAPVRLGLIEPAEPAPSAQPAAPPPLSTADSVPPKEPAPSDPSQSKASTRLRFGYAAMPEGKQLRLRMCGLLWPEAAQRLANAAWLVREPVGNGQVILFASAPTFRAATLGTARVLGNAVVYGPGAGARPTIEP